MSIYLPNINKYKVISLGDLADRLDMNQSEVQDMIVQMTNSGEEFSKFYVSDIPEDIQNDRDVLIKAASGRLFVWHSDDSLELVENTKKSTTTIVGPIRITTKNTRNGDKEYKISITFENGMTFRDLPESFHKLIAKLGAPGTHEEWLTIPGLEDGDIVPGSKEAIVGILVPDSLYESVIDPEGKVQTTWGCPEIGKSVPIYCYKSPVDAARRDRKADWDTSIPEKEPLLAPKETYRLP